MSFYAVDKLMSEARRIAAEYRRTTGKSLGISSEIAKHDACRLLGLEAVDDAGGYDAFVPDSKLRIQIKGRTIFDESKSGQRIGQLKLDKEWDAVVLVLMNEDFDSFEIYQANREEIEDALGDENDTSRNKRGIMSVSRFKRIARLVWSSETGPILDDVWDNQSS